jgi:hypothetical protein
MVQVIDNQVAQTSLPTTGYLSTGESVSGYNLLPPDKLKAESWLPTEDNIPTYDPATQMAVVDSYTIMPDKVTINYRIEAIVVTE